MMHTFKKCVFTAMASIACFAAQAADPATLGGTISPTPALWPTITPEQYETFSFQINNNSTASTDPAIQFEVTLSNLDFGEPFDASIHISHPAGTTVFNWSYNSGTKKLTAILAGNFAQFAGNTFTINRLIVQAASPQPSNLVGAEVLITTPVALAPSPNTSGSNDETDSYTFTSATIRGRVWNDTDGSATINGGEQFITNGSVWANLVNAANAVVSSVQVNASGNYAFNLLSPNTSYRVILTTSNQTGNNNLTVSDVPTNSTFKNVGVNLAGTANAGNQTGIVSAATTVDVNFLEQNFGIERPPTATNNVNAPYGDITENTKYALSPNATDPQAGLSGTDPEQGALGTGNSFRITGTLPANAKLYYNNVLITQAMVDGATGAAVITNYNPDLLAFSVDNQSVSSVFFTYIALDAAGLAGPTGTYSISALSILPVTGLHLKAQVANSKPVLQWVTVTEQNTSNFEIERSYDGASYAKIGTMAAAGNSNTKRNYTLVDNAAHSAKTIYYRVRLMDKNGKAVVSNIATVSFGTAVVNIYPSPATSQVYVNGAAVGSQLVVMGIDGKIVKQATANGSGLDKLNVSSLASGTYLMQITATDGSTSVFRFIKAK